MDFNIVTLEVADLIIHFDYYNNLISAVADKTGATDDEQAKIRGKRDEHLAEFVAPAELYDKKKQLRSLYEISGFIMPKLQGMKTKDIHALVEKLEKDVKKIKKLYKSTAKK